MAILGGVLGFWGGVGSMGTLFLMVLMAQRFFCRRREDKKEVGAHGSLLFVLVLMEVSCCYVAEESLLMYCWCRTYFLLLVLREVSCCYVAEGSSCFIDAEERVMFYWC